MSLSEGPPFPLPPYIRIGLMADEEVAPEEFDEGDVDGEAAAAEVDEVCALGAVQWLESPFLLAA